MVPVEVGLAADVSGIDDVVDNGVALDVDVDVDVDESRYIDVKCDSVDTPSFGASLVVLVAGVEWAGDPSVAVTVSKTVREAIVGRSVCSSCCS